MKIEVVINFGSGTNDTGEAVPKLHDMFQAHGVTAQIHVAKTGADLINLAKEAIRCKSGVIVAGGGDGTISSVAALILDSGKTLGVLPLGTLNHFAKDLRIPVELEGAVKTIAAGHTTMVDVGEVNDRVFINNSSLGLYPRIVREREKQQRLGSGKWPAFIWAAIAVLRRYPFLEVNMMVDNKALTRRTPFVFVGNNEYEMDILNIGGRSVLNGGHLSLYLTNPMGRLGLIRLALLALLGRLRREKDFLALQTQEVKISTKHKRMRIALDGEVDVMQPPLHYRIRPQALRVLVPKPEDSTKTLSID